MFVEAVKFYQYPIGDFGILDQDSGLGDIKMEKDFKYNEDELSLFSSLALNQIVLFMKIPGER